MPEGHVDIVFGTQWGDEGKGRLVDMLIEEHGHEWVVRYNGGANAGHTIEVDGQRLALHQIPSGIHHPKVKLYIGPGCVVNLVKLEQEIQGIEKAGFLVRHRLRIAAQASVVQPSHILEDRRTMGAVGTTGNGISPAYAASVLRVEGDRRLDYTMGNLLASPERSFAGIRKNLEVEKQRLNVPGTECDVDREMEELQTAFEKLRSLVEQNPEMLVDANRAGMRMLLEAGQAWGLDPKFGSPPFTTGSRTGANAASMGAGLPLGVEHTIYGVAKLIPSRVGWGPFPTEFGGRRSEGYCMEQEGTLHTLAWEQEHYGCRIDELLRSVDSPEMGIALRLLGQEYGATTGRPRRLGKFDAVQVRSALKMNGLPAHTRLFLTKADCLRSFAHRSGIPVAFEYALNDCVLDYPPTTEEELRMAQPVYVLHEPFDGDISALREWSALPVPVQRHITNISKEVGYDIAGIGVGPGREQVVRVAL